MRRHHIHGYNADVDIGSEDLWTGGGAYPFPAAAAATTIVSGSASDTAAGTGARTVKVIGLDANFSEINEVVTLNGATPVNLVGVYLRILRAFVLTAGSGGTNAGALSIKQSSTVIAEIVASQGRTQMAIFTAPAGNLNYIVKKFFVAAVNAVAGAVSCKLWTRKSGGVWQVRSMISVYGTSKSAQDYRLETPIELDAGEDVRLEATTTADNTAVAGILEIEGGSVAEIDLHL